MAYRTQKSWELPQGSVLEPLLFLIYIRKMIRLLSTAGNSKIFLFADDTRLVMKVVVGNIDVVSNNASKEIS